MIECENEEANGYLKDLCGKNWRAHRALVFLDPYGMQVEWKTIESIAQTEAIDLWLLFPIGTVNRLLKRNGEIRPSIREKLNLFFGNEQWFEVFYRLAQRIPIFNEDEQWEKTGDIFSEIEQYIRIDALCQTDAHIKFLSLEPLLGALPNLKLDSIDWVIVGGESGPGAREIKKKWVTDIRDQCADANVHFFFKQWGGRQKSKTGRELDGKTYDEMPV